MKKLIQIISLIVAFASIASAQTTVSVGAQSKQSTAAQDLLTPKAAQLDNKITCLNNGLPVTCTQANLDAKCPAGGCGTIYALTVAGYQQYALDKMFAGYFDFLDAKIKAINVQDLDSQGAANGGLIASNAECANAVGGSLGNGCTRFAIACRALSGGTSSDCK